MKVFLALFFGLALAAASTSHRAAAQFRFAEIFDHGMVMQRETPVPVWGWSSPGDEVILEFAGQTLTTRARVDGRWQIELPPMEPGGPYSLVARSGPNRVEISDVFFGDVWVASGQSNMEWTVVDSKDADAEIASAGDPFIRHFKVPRSWSEHPQDDLVDGEWEVASPETVGDFSAVAYFFAREIREHVDVPIGIINSTWGGMRIEPWMSREALGLDVTGFEMVMEREAEREQAIMDRLRERIGELPATDLGLVNQRALWADTLLDDTTWDLVPVPAPWEEVGYEGLDGVGWYRSVFELTEEEAQRGISLSLGTIDDSDVTFVNEVEVGRMEQAWNQQRLYQVPPDVLREGRNVIAIRVEDTGGGGGIVGDPNLLYLDTGTERRPLAGEWRFRVGAVVPGVSARRAELPTVLYNQMIHPLTHFPITGVIWYQGESNAYPGDALEYRDLFADMIRDWRQQWNAEDDFPFLFVQLANFMAADDEPSESTWAVLRESQSAVLETVPNTAEAVTIDIGDPDDIHPTNKQDVGHRLALAARHLAYGQDVVHSGPRYDGHEIRDGRVYIEFDHVGSGLTTGDEDDSVGGFAVAGPDGRFRWAEARIEEDRVVVWSEEVNDPVAVRYGWGDNPDRANLYNEEGLPAPPFRTDRPE
ncbi:MAG: sialate O-acetylesterase [Bacteroidota bacterium]